MSQGIRPAALVEEGRSDANLDEPDRSIGRGQTANRCGGTPKEADRTIPPAQGGTALATARGGALPGEYEERIGGCVPSEHLVRSLQ